MVRPFFSRWSPRVVAAFLILCSAGVAYTRERIRRATGVQHARFFIVDLDRKQVQGPPPRVLAALHLDLVSVTVDQPQYWPSEPVYLRILALGRPGASFTGKLQKRDSQARDLSGTLDEQGAAVLRILDGEKAPLELGEYRVDLSIASGKAKGTATFAVVQGSLGSMAFAHEFAKVTRAQDLDSRPAGWFLGNAAGAGLRWGNGLSFKNELRVSNHPYSGTATVHSRCMLPGCNGALAGPSQLVTVEKGQLAGTLVIGGHSGPFQIEVTTSRGSLRHQFEGSSHVERELVAAAGGVSFQHRVGVAPYENTKQVPGRDLFVETKPGTADPFTIESILAQDGMLTLRANRSITAPLLIVHRPKPDGTYESQTIPVAGPLTASRTLRVPVRPPYSLVTIGGFDGQTFKEGWAFAFPPSDLRVALEAPKEGKTRGTATVVVQANESSGKPARVSAILEVYDSRVPARSPNNPLASALGDSVRALSRAVSGWVDNTQPIVEYIEDPVPRQPLSTPKRRSSKSAEDSADGLSGIGSGKGGGGVGVGSIGLGSLGTVGRGSGQGFAYGAAAGSVSSVRMASPSVSGRMAGGRGQGGSAASDELPHEEIREGDRKVVFCGLVATDSEGKARVEVPLPPQTGRLVLRLTAARSLEHATTQTSLDVTRDAAVEPRVPRTFVAGARLTIPVDTMNNTGQPLTLLADGIGLDAPVERSVPAGQGTVDVPLTLYKPGDLTVTLRDATGRIRDQRVLPLQTISSTPVTYSRLIFSDGAAVSKLTLAAGETARIYPSTGPLLAGMVQNVLTTTESWFGHAEALSARAAVRATLLAAISKRILDDEGLSHTLRVGVDKDIRDLAEVFCDAAAEGLCRPYPTLAPQPRWTIWVTRNLLSTVHALEQAASPDPLLRQALATATKLTQRLQQALLARGLNTAQEGGFDSQGAEVIPVEIDGQVVYKTLVDDAVTRWASEHLLPRLSLDDETQDIELALSKQADAARFLRAFERVGNRQALTDLAIAYYKQGKYSSFAALYRRIARGMILSQEPGLIQGPALLGGVYSTPMALVRFLSLQILVAGHQKATSAGQQGDTALTFDRPITGPATLTLGMGAIARVDRKDNVLMAATPTRYGTVSLSSQDVQLGQEVHLTVTLDPSRDPLEYYALIAVPTTASVKQTADILSDAHGQLIYGQQGQGGTQMQFLAVPFRGSRTLSLLAEGVIRGSSPGLVVIRHIESPTQVSGLPIPALVVR